MLWFLKFDIHFFRIFLYILVPGMDYDPLTYRAVKDHPLGLRSVYNEDLPLSLVKPAMKDIYTTWKARKVKWY